MTPRLACHLIFRLEGVVTQSAEAALLAELGGSSRVTDVQVRTAVRDLASAVRSGELDWTGLCSKAASLAGWREDGSLLGKRALGGVRLADGIQDLLTSLNGVLDAWLFCEIAEAVMAPTMERLMLDRCVPRSRWLFSSGRFRVEMPGELIARLMERMAARREELLWVDDRPAVTAALIRAGMNAVAFVDPFRLRRNLVLRGLLQ
jgi:hypothetical protein